ncbi:MULTISPECIES: hypothetical protein [Metallosphaera]|nr:MULTISPECIES: hypothetical protein [Metallosphaera]AKV73355.1 hypothetical protein MsedA_0194 [Metallosphaera sedula]AKV75599.1 hypothetical protein MsedB_0194 [Metallosphaera sedula]AKV77845.1 hypothetical protein MsedC_0193 [Metallosphaera sedula]AKV80090.1 hypothetical protein MsedD_0194 [Metallosphaera sedula]AKV82334.1 hypothetical protein MsedE_0194 [Metallosphaera sedula]
MMKDLLGDYEPRGKVIQGVGKFIAFGLDDPFHLTTVTGLAIYGAGKLMERRSNYGIRRAKLDMTLTMLELKNLVEEIHGIRIQ